MLVIGITGGIGSGKSAVADILRGRGWYILDSDATAREAFRDAEVREAVLARFGTIERPELAALVFGDTPVHRKNLMDLNAIVHPYVRRRHREDLGSLQEKGVAITGVDSPLIYEAGLQDMFDYIIVVSAPENVRVLRVMERSGLSEDEVRRRIARQSSDESKRMSADYVITNDSSKAALASATEAIAIEVENLALRS